LRDFAGPVRAFDYDQSAGIGTAGYGAAGLRQCRFGGFRARLFLQYFWIFHGFE
jgi:hypothetical protein